MIKVGLTGGIGSGKSYVAGIFSALGVPIFYADAEAKSSYSNSEVLEQIKFLFGNIVFDEQNINITKLSNHVFSNKQALDKLNEIFHPYVLARFNKWIDQYVDTAYIIMESAILYETGYDSIFNKIIVVDAPVELCIERVMLRDKIEEDMVLKRMSNQYSNAIKSKKADFVIYNNSSDFISKQVIELHNLLLSLE